MFSPVGVIYKHHFLVFDFLGVASAVHCIEGNILFYGVSRISLETSITPIKKSFLDFQ